MASGSGGEAGTVAERGAHHGTAGSHYCPGRLRLPQGRSIIQHEETCPLLGHRGRLSMSLLAHPDHNRRLGITAE